jgi:hypothetical protein
MGHLICWDEGGGSKHTREYDTVSCSHCQKVMEKKRWKAVGHWCFVCGKPACGEDNPACHIKSLKGCVPFMKKVEQELARSRFYIEAGGVR